MANPCAGYGKAVRHTADDGKGCCVVGRDGIKLSSGDSADWNFKPRVSGASHLKVGPLGCRSLDSEWGCVYTMENH